MLGIKAQRLNALSSDIEEATRKINQLAVQTWLTEAQTASSVSRLRVHLARLAGSAAAIRRMKLTYAARKMRSLLARPSVDAGYTVRAVQRFFAKIYEDQETCAALAASDAALSWLHPELRERAERTYIQSVYLSTVLEIERMIDDTDLERRSLP